MNKEYLIIKNAKQVLTLRGFSDRPKIGKEMADLGMIENGAVVCEGDKILAVGKSELIFKKHKGKNVKVIDASNKVVMPGFVDCHTHLVFAGNRADEFAEKIHPHTKRGDVAFGDKISETTPRYGVGVKGTPYLEILAKGGGILSTVRKTREALDNDGKGLKDDCLKRLKMALSLGTTTMEIKSGYGLDLKSEMAMLKMIKELQKFQSVDLILTLLGAHAIPPEFKGERNNYVKLVFRMINEAKKRKLAEFCDVFCEDKAFTLKETKEILEKAKKAGLKLKLHASQFNDLGAVELGVELGAVSIDHLEKISDGGIKAMADSKTVGVLLPGCEFHLGTKNYAPARKMIGAGVPIALATDFNPGSSPIISIPMILGLACRELKMTPEETISAATINAAHALGRAQEIGSLELGKKADILILDIEDYRELPYWFGINPVGRVIKNGKIAI